MSQTNVRCINCELRVTRFKRLLCNEDNALINIIRRWTYPRDVSKIRYKYNYIYKSIGRTLERLIEFITSKVFF